MQPTRLLRLLNLLGAMHSGKAYNADSLAVACGVSRRTIFRDLELLRTAGVPLLFTEDDRRYRLDTTHLLPPTQFTAEEAMAVISLGHELGATGRLPFYEAAWSASIKLESLLPSELRDQVRAVLEAVSIRLEPTSRPNEETSTYRRLLDAITHKRVVEIRYDSFTEGDHLETELSPYRLLFSRRGWYVVGRSSTHGEARTFSLSRIERLSPLEKSFEVPPSFSLQEYLRNAWHLIPEPGPDQEILIRFQPMVARNVAEVRWHHTQSLECQPDATLLFRATVSGLNEVSWWILGYGDQAEVLAPPALRSLVAERARRMLSRYNDVAV